MIVHDRELPRVPSGPDLGWMLSLNNALHIELGLLAPPALQRLLDQAFRVRVIAPEDAFIIALEQGADYDSPNYRWFSSRYDRFTYIDRVAVAGHARKRGLARLLYNDLFAAARDAGHTRIACEVNYDPPNPASEAFHERLEFREVGRGTLPDRGKSVRYLLRDLA